MYNYSAVVTRWIDGDTFKAQVDVGFGITINETFRVLGINAPEMNTPEGPVAKSYAETLVPVGRTALLRTTKKDKYGRWLGDFLFLDGTSLSEKMIASGNAVPYLLA